MNYLQSKAVVLGGSMAGLLAARVLSEHYSEIIIVDRDEFPTGPENRAGTPQAFHPHRWLPRGKIIMEKLFPGYTAELLENGAFNRENKTIRLIGPFGDFEVPDELDAGCSRAMFEWLVRSRVRSLPNVRIMSRQDVIGLQTNSDNTRVTGVYLRGREETVHQTTLPADMVVDATGRSTKVLGWLAAMGYDLLPAERLQVALGYSTRHFKLPEHLADKYSAILAEAQPARGIGSGAFGTIENGIAEMTLYRAGGESYPTTDPDRYLEEAARLLTPAVAEVLKEMTPVDAPRGFRVPECIRQHFEKMEKWPSGLLVLGDAMCHFDPVFGQGMTVAAIEAEMIGTCLSEQGCSLSPNFEQEVFERMQAAIEPAWWLSTVADLRWKGVKYSGPVSLQGMAFAQKFLDLYLKQAYMGHPEFFERYYNMTGLLTSPRELINARVLEDLLALETPEDARQFLAEFVEPGQSIQKFIDRVIPSFEHSAMPFSILLV